VTALPIGDLAKCAIPPEAISFRDTEALAEHLRNRDDIELSTLGQSRAGQLLYGYTMGTGPLTVSITAGCHADEPIGPMTAQILPELLRRHAPELLELFSFRVAPQMNPDGADANRSWFANNPDFPTYVEHAVREAPGDDVEFGFSEDEKARPECRAAIPFLWHHNPVVVHFSLHGMAWSEGAWYLLNEPWAGRADRLMDELIASADCHDMPLHEIDRKGLKGFTRIREGVATTPSSIAMRAFFDDENDPEMAAKFLPSSMEVAMATGDDPLCMVSELPLFLLDMPSSIKDPVLFRFRDALNDARAEGGPEAIQKLIRDFRLRTVPIATQIQLQFTMMVRALHHVASQRARPSK
jgi:hypothetical protein